MEIYPIMIDEAPAGKLTVERQGARTVFSAECRMLPGVVRISVYGGGREGYLGVLAPEGEALRLKKSLSRNQMREFPPEIDSVERSGLPPSHFAPEEPEQPRPEPELKEERKAPGPEDACRPLPAEAEKPPEEAPEAERTGEARDDRAEEEAPGEAEELSWYSSPDGALVCFDGSSNLIALPLGDDRIPEDVPGVRRTVEGRDYLVYRTREGRIVR